MASNYDQVPTKEEATAPVDDEETALQSTSNEDASDDVAVVGKEQKNDAVSRALVTMNSARDPVKLAELGKEFSRYLEDRKLDPNQRDSPIGKDPPPPLTGRYRLIAEQDALAWSNTGVRLAVLATALGLQVLQPSYPFLVIPGATPYSFPSTDPFGFSSATYFLPLSGLFGAAITSSFIGNLSDRVGRRPCFLVCLFMSAVTAIIQYFARETFWGYCGATFANGLFAASIPVGLAYASDVNVTRAKKDEEIGILVGFNMLGMAGGGMIAILMENINLFSPLLVAAGLDFVAFVFCCFFVLEPDKKLEKDPGDELNQDDEEDDAPDKINYWRFSNVILGALFDNIGSSGLYPLALSPLAFTAYVVSPEMLLGETAYKWLVVSLALMVIPGAIITQPVYARIGAAGGCVVGNLVTAIGIMACLFITKIDPPSNGSMWGFIVTLYGIFPMTVLSQLSTGPMLDMLAPVNQRGFAQGLNMTIMNFAMALSPWMLGVMADEVGVEETIWLCVGISVFAALVNLPLMFAPELKRKPPVDYQKAMGLEDDELVALALKGEWVPAKFLDDLNYSRFQKGLRLLKTPVVEYSEDKKNLEALKKHAREDFDYHRYIFHVILNDLSQPGGKKRSADQLRKVVPPKDESDAAAEDMGKWFGEYLKDNGYFLDGGWPPVYKQMVMQAFPPINVDGEITEDNVESMFVHYLANMNRFLRESPQSQAGKAFRGSVVC